MPGKWPDQTLDQTFGLPEVLVAVSTPRLSRKRERTLMPVWDSSGASSHPQNVLQRLNQQTGIVSDVPVLLNVEERPRSIAAFIVHASGEPFERRPSAFVVPQRFCSVRPSGGQLQLPTFTDRAESALRSCCTSPVSAPATRVPSDKVTSTGSDEFPCRFNEIG